MTETSGRRRLAALGSLALLSLFAVAMVGARAAFTGRVEGLNLVWNLFLAWIPLALALLVHGGYRRGVPRGLLLAGAGLWLLFFPNAPYLVTGFKHLQEWVGAPVWFDIVLVATSAWTGLLLGFVSLYLIHGVARRAAGAATAWAVVVASTALGSFGLYLGRFERWNSWDLFTRPRLLLGDVWARAADPAAHPRTVAVTLLFTVFLTLAYLAFYSVVRLGPAEQRERRELSRPGPRAAAGGTPGTAPSSRR